MNKNDLIEQMRSTQQPLTRMVEMVPDDQLSWAPAEGFMTMAQLLKHLSANWCIIKMQLHLYLKLLKLPVNTQTLYGM